MKKKILILNLRKNFLKIKILNLLDLLIILSILEKNLQKAHPKMEKEKVLALKVRKNLKVETVDLKTLHLKNIVKKEDNLKIF